MADIHRFQQRYQQALVNLQQSSLHQEDKKGIETFLRDARVKGTGYARLIKLCQVLIRLGTRLNKVYAKATENDLKNLIYEYSFWTRHDITVILKQY